MLLICPVRPGDDNPELRHALRSWEANLPYDDRVLLTVGHCPSWLKPNMHLPANRYQSLPIVVWDNIVRVSEWVDTDEPALYMNDDFFCLNPVESVPVVHRNWTLPQHIARSGRGWWGQSLRLTHDWLAAEGLPHQISYEAHVPLPASPAAMFEALSRWGFGNAAYVNGVPQWRTIYGNVVQPKSEPILDVKLGLHEHNPITDWVSTSDQSWLRYRGAIEERFQKPSRWEI